MNAVHLLNFLFIKESWKVLSQFSQKILSSMTLSK